MRRGGRGAKGEPWAPMPLARQLFTGLEDSNWSIGLIEEEAIRDPAGAIHRIARSVDDGHVRPNGPEPLGYVPTTQSAGELDVREDDIDAAPALQALDGAFGSGDLKNIPSRAA